MCEYVDFFLVTTRLECEKKKILFCSFELDSMFARRDWGVFRYVFSVKSIRVIFITENELEDIL